MENELRAGQPILGHQKQQAYLKRSFAAGRLAHAQLFFGPDAIGKKQVALWLAQLLNCQDQTGCGQCPACQKTIHQKHPDFCLLEPEGQYIKIDRVRELTAFLRLKPYEGAYKVVIIDQAERLNMQAGNALLKTLEAPPGHSVILLITANPAGILPTIFSRCQGLRFAEIPQESLVNALLKEGVSQTDASLRAALAGGSLSKALMQDSNGYQQRRDHLLEQLLTWTPRRVTPLFAFAEKVSRDKEELYQVLVCLQKLYRDKLFLSYQLEERFLLNKDIIERLAGWPVTGKAAAAALWNLEAAHKELRANVAPRLLLEKLLLNLVAQKS